MAPAAGRAKSQGPDSSVCRERAFRALQTARKGFRLVCAWTPWAQLCSRTFVSRRILCSSGFSRLLQLGAADYFTNQQRLSFKHPCEKNLAFLELSMVRSEMAPHRISREVSQQRPACREDLGVDMGRFGASCVSSVLCVPTDSSDQASPKASHFQAYGIGP